MTSSYRMLLTTTIIILIIIQINGGYWVCDWVNGRGWMYCSRGHCSSFGKKRSISTDDEQTGPIQNNDGTYCVDNKFCYTCEPINDDACRITLQLQDFPIPRPYSSNKREVEDLCP